MYIHINTHICIYMYNIYTHKYMHMQHLYTIFECILMETHQHAAWQTACPQD